MVLFFKASAGLTFHEYRSRCHGFNGSRLPNSLALRSLKTNSFQAFNWFIAALRSSWGSVRSSRSKERVGGNFQHSNDAVVTGLKVLVGFVRNILQVPSEKQLGTCTF